MSKVSIKVTRKGDKKKVRVSLEIEEGDLRLLQFLVGKYEGIAGSQGDGERALRLKSIFNDAIKIGYQI